MTVESHDVEYEHPPKAYAWIQGMSTQDLIFLVTSTVCCFIVILVSFVEYVNVKRHVTYESVRHHLTWIVFMLPVTTIVSVVGMFFPRSAMFLEMVSASYLMITLGVVIKLIEHLFGSRKAIVTYMNSHKIKIDLVAAFNCCTKLAPSFLKLNPTPFRIHVIEYLVYQTAFLRIITITTVMIGFFENHHTESLYTTVSEYIMVVSLVLCIYGTEVMKKNTENAMEPFRFGWIHNIVSASHMTSVLGKVIFLNLIERGYIEIGFINQAEAKALYLTFFVYSILAVILSFISLVVLNPKQNALFDRHGVARPALYRTEEVPLVALLTQTPR